MVTNFPTLRTERRRKASDFDLSKEIKFDPRRGLTTFRGSRLLIFEADAIGLLRRNLIDDLGWDTARGFLLRFGFEHGYSDFCHMDDSYDFETEMELLASGPVVHTYEGLVQATPTKIKFDRDSGDFLFSGIWTNSYEAEQHLRFHEKSEHPVCWTLMGYASGWCTAFFGRPLLAIEPVCVGRGDDHCEWLIQPPDVWGDAAKPYIQALGDLAKKSRE